MSSKGFIKLDRAIEDSWVYDTGEPWDKAHAWIDLILLASWKDGEFLYGGDVVEKKRGQVCRSIRSLASRWHWSEHKTRDFLNLLEKNGMIRRDTAHHGSVITVENYSKYQDVRPESGAPMAHDGRTEGAPTAHERIHTIKERKEEGKNVRSRAFRPPTLTDVQEYADERLLLGKPRVDPERFMDFYQSKGWMVGKSKMKDWKAAFRGWETRQREEARKSDEDVDWLDL